MWIVTKHEIDQQIKHFKAFVPITSEWKPQWLTEWQSMGLICSLNLGRGGETEVRVVVGLTGASGPNSAQHPSAGPSPSLPLYILPCNLCWKKRVKMTTWRITWPPAQTPSNTHPRALSSPCNLCWKKRELKWQLEESRGLRPIHTPNRRFNWDLSCTIFLRLVMSFWMDFDAFTLARALFYIMCPMLRLEKAAIKMLLKKIHFSGLFWC